MADSLCTFLTVDRSGPEQQEPPPRLPLPPLPLLHESQHGYADPDRPLPRVLHTDEIRGWHWGLTLRHLRCSGRATVSPPDGRGDETEYEEL